MTFWRRVSAGFCALVLVAALAAFPLRARATATAATVTLAAAGFAFTVVAFLNMAGIYPYVSGGTFSDWSSGGLADLIQRYNNTGPSTLLDVDTVRAYMYGGTALLTHNAYVALKAFVQWIKDTFSLADNQDSVDIGNASVQWTDGYLRLPRAVSTPSVSWMVDNGGVYFYRWNDSTASSSTSTAPYYYATSWDKPIYMGFYRSSFSPSGISALVGWRSSDVSSLSYGPPCYNYSAGYSWNNNAWVLGSSVNSNWLGSYQVNGRNYISSGYVYGVIPDGAVVFDTESAFGAAINGASNTSGSVGTVGSDFTLDTSTLAVLPDIAADADYIGLAVSPGTVEGVSATMTPQAVQQIIQQGVIDRERPVVTPVEVQLATGVEIDGTGVITDTSPVVIAPDAFPLSPGDYAIPSLSTVFPFSVPWDIARIFQALDAEPRFPLEDFTFTLDVPFLFGNSPPSVSLGLASLPQELSAKINDIASLVRNLALIAACIGWLIFITKFIRF